MTKLVVIGGSDAGISAALRARELDPGCEVDLLVADRWPNFSICGLPYLIGGEVATVGSLAHRTADQIAQTGTRVHLQHTATAIDPDRRVATTRTPEGDEREFAYDALVIGTGAVPQRPPIAGLDLDGVHLLHTVDDALAVIDRLDTTAATRAVIVGAGYIGLEMAESLRRRDLTVTLVERLPEVMPTVDPQIGARVRAELMSNGVGVHTSTTVDGIAAGPDGLVVTTSAAEIPADLVLVVTGVRPDVALGARLGLATGAGGALVVDDHMRTALPGVFAGGDCVHTHHRLLPEPIYMPLGSTAHKQGRVAGENAIGGDRAFAGVLGTQVVKVFDLAIAGTGLRDATAPTDLYQPSTIEVTVDDHKRYYPGAVELTVRLCGDRDSGRLLGGQIIGGLSGQVAKRIDILAAAIFNEMPVDALSDVDLSYTPPFSAPWDPVQAAAQAWTAEQRVASTTSN